MSFHLTIYTDDPDKGGVAHYNHALARALAGEGVRVSIVQAPSAAATVAEREALGIAHRWIDYDTQKDFGRTLVDGRTAGEALAELRPDVVLFSDCCPVSNLAAKQVATKLGVPWVAIVHFAAPYLATRFQPVLGAAVRQWTAAHEVIAVSTENLQLLRKLFGLPAGKGTVIFNGIADRFFAPRAAAVRTELRARLQVADGTLLSLTSARMNAVKLHTIQVHAMRLLAAQKSLPRVECVWLGDGELRPQLEKEIAQHGLQERFHLVGQQSDVGAWLDAADCFTLTSQSEGMPLAISEAMARELPVVATAVSGIPEQLANTGALLPSPEQDAAGAVKQLAATWAKWARDPAGRQALGGRARKRAETVFRAAGMVRATRALLEAAVSRGLARA